MKSFYNEHGVEYPEFSPKVLDPNEDNPVALWARIYHLESLLKGPDGFETWQDAAVSERIRRVKAEKELEELKKKPVLPDNEVVYNEVLHDRNKLAMYISTNAVNDVMAAVRRLHNFVKPN